MNASTIRRPLAGLALALLVLVGAPLPSALAAADNVRVVTYDASRAEEFQDAVDQGAQVWNDHVTNVRFEPAEGTDADLVVLADDGWPRAQPDGLGAGTVWMGRQAMDEGHDVLRVAAHELGHILGLPDRRTGVCGELMSGASAGTDCANSTPNAVEIDEVEQNFAEREADRAAVAAVRASVY